MKVIEGLQIIRQRLVENGATPETLSLVDTIMQRAALPAAAAASTHDLDELAAERLVFRRGPCFLITPSPGRGLLRRRSGLVDQGNASEFREADRLPFVRITIERQDPSSGPAAVDDFLSSHGRGRAK